MNAATLEEWHKRLGHPNKDILKRMIEKKAVIGMDVKNGPKIYSQCEGCLMNKCHQVSHSQRTTQKAKKPGESLHFDTIGPIEQESMGGARFVLLCKDEYSSFRIIKFMSSKKDIPAETKVCISQARLDTGNDVLSINTDNGTEFKANELSSFTKSKGIIQHFSVPYTPQQNGFIERDIRTIKEAARTMLNEADMPRKLWAEAMNTAVYVLNRTLTSKADETPYEKWTGTRPNISNLHIFGQNAVSLKLKNQRRTFDTKGEKLRFVGYTDRFNTFRFYNEVHNIIEIKCDVRFVDEPIQRDSNDLVVDDPGLDIAGDHFESDNDLDEESMEEGSVEKQPLLPPRKSSMNTSHKMNQGDLAESCSDNQPKEGYTPKITPRKSLSKVSNETMSESSSRKLLDLTSRDDTMTWDQEGIQLSSDNRPIRPMKGNAYMDADFDPEKAFNRRNDPTYKPGPSTKGGNLYTNTKEAFLEHKVPKKLWGSNNKPPEVLETRTRGDDGKPKFYGKLSTIEQDQDPKTYSEAMSRSDHERWKQAMNEEIESLRKNRVYEVVERPNTSIVTCRWVFVTKRKPNGDIDRYKARLVARGFSQIYGLDYTETFAPVVNNNSIRLLLAYAAVEKLHLGQFDVKTAFLNGELDETIYMDPPEGYDKNKAWLLKKSLYGLKQAPRQWNKKFDDTLQAMNLSVSEYDHCIYYRKQPLLIIAIYVDDGIIIAKDAKEITKAMSVLSHSFEMTSTELSTFLGFQIERGPNGEISLHQESYINKILRKYEMDNCKTVDNPCSIEETKQSEGELEKSPKIGPDVPYKEAVGSLLYAMINTRIDIAYAVGKTSRKVADPTENDWKMVKRIFRYLKGKEQLALTYSYDKNRGMVAYCDADFAGDLESAKSTTGMVIFYGGAPICWKSKRQPLVARSTTEAELISMEDTVDEATWLREMALELDIIDERPVPILCDNESTIRIVENERSIQRTRHLRARASYIREEIDNQSIEVAHVKSDNQIADMLTKATTGPKFTRNRNLLMNFLTILMMLITMLNKTEQMIFDRVNPIVWTHTKNYVGGSKVHYVIQLHYLDPCEKLRQIPRPAPIQIKYKRTFKIHHGPKGNYSLIQNMTNLSYYIKNKSVRIKKTNSKPVRTLETALNESSSDYTRIKRQSGQYPSNPPTNYNPNVGINLQSGLPIQNNIPQPPSYPSAGSDQSLPNDWNLAIEGAVDICHRLYHEQIITPLEKMSVGLRPKDLPQEEPHRPMARFKRGVIIPVMIGMFMSNILGTLKQGIWTSQDSTETRTKVQYLLQELRDMNERLNLTAEAETAEANALHYVAKIAQETKARLSHFIHNFPRISYTGQYFAAHIAETGRLLSQLQFRNQPESQIDVPLVRQLINDTHWLEDVEPSSTQLKVLGSDLANTFRMEFYGRKREKNHYVYKVNAFKIFSNLDNGKAALMEYRGPEYIVYNSENGCVRQVNGAIREVITGVDCSKPYLDKALSNWIKVAEFENPKDAQTSTAFIESFPFTYIYCYPHSITLDTGYSFRCQPFVFKLNSTVGWNTTDGIQYIPSAMEYLNDQVKVEYNIPDVHFKTFEHLIDGNMAIDKIFNLTSKIKDLERENIAVNLPVTQGGLTYAQMMHMFIWITGIMLVLIVYVSIRKMKADKQRHIQVMKTVTDSTYGDGTYETLRVHRKAQKRRTRINPSKIIRETLHIGTQNVYPASRHCSSHSSVPIYEETPI